MVPGPKEIATFSPSSMGLGRRDSCLVECFLTAWAVCGRINTKDVHPAIAASSSGFKQHEVKESGGGFCGASGSHPTPMSWISLNHGTGSMRRAKQELLAPSNGK